MRLSRPSITTKKRLAAGVHDVIAAGFSMWLALLLRYGWSRLPPSDEIVAAVVIFAVVAGFSFWAFGVGRGIWRFASLTDLRNIVLASTTTVLSFLVLMFLVNRLAYVPRSVPLIAWFILIVMLAAPRLVHRLVKDGGIAALKNFRTAPARRQRLLIVASAGQADRIIRRFGLEGSPNYRVVGVVDYKLDSRGRSIRGAPLLGGASEINAILANLERNELKPDAIVLAAPQEHREELQPIATAAAAHGIAVKRVAESADLLGDDEPEFRSVTLDDLLGRPPVRLELDQIRHLIRDRIVLITGAGGSIGSEIARQVAGYGPSRLVLVDSGEYNLYSIDRAIAETAPALDRASLIADVRDRDRIHRIIERERPGVIFHAAALKHVPLVEWNTSEGVLTNVIGTRNVADAAVANGVEAMVVISTDKAIRPTSAMGATKRVAEAYCQALDVSADATRFITVRFGNVLGSNGSVVPLFEQQIRAGGPVTVTHPDMKRYFMTIREAAELVLQAAVHGLGHPDERGRILVLDMGEPVRIVELARMLIALSGFRPDVDIAIAYTGLRPGEKLFEELFDPEEATAATSTAGVFVASPRLFPREALMSALRRIEDAARADDVEEVRQILGAIVPEFAGTGAGGALPKRVPATPAAGLAATPRTVH
ncbi:polysaccharide biosynthesis protein [Faunimonas sp. B44]|uniref:polysaccharide biosynthesis protein n=1 Tax=Faunimonas sp. B44 TaxID=3461493 RepID=UPI004044DE7C